MTIWEYRQWIESAVPAWVPVAMAVCGLIGLLLIDAAKWLDNGGDE